MHSKQQLEKNTEQQKQHIHKNTKQFRECPGEVLPPISSKDIAAFVSKQNNKTSQPVVVNFLIASIDSISFPPPLGDTSRYSTGENGKKTRQEEIERVREDSDRVPAGEKQLRT